MLEIYDNFKDGYDPFLIREGWQIAKLTYLEQQSIGKINKIDKHEQTDEAFILLSGRAALIIATEKRKEWQYECIEMQYHKIYNIPAGIWHNIVLFENTEIIIIEADNTHLNDAIYQSLSSEEKGKLNNFIQETLQ